MMWRKALFLNLTAALTFLSGPASSAPGKQGDEQATTLVDLMLKDRFSIQLISGVLRNKGVNALGGFLGVTYYFSP